jgi:hypothetical protein
MYNAAQQGGATNGNGQPTGNADADVTDVDFEEVKDGK